MPELMDQMYCSQQIVIPPKFPYILKRYCKAAIKTQPYDLLRWSYEYFRALSHRHPPPVKLRLEYPVYSTEGGLTRGCLKVLANQLAGMTDVPLTTLRGLWQGFCLDPQELRRIFCLCEVYLRAESVPFLHFIGVAGGLLTKSLTNTMILLCETLTAEPDGGSAHIPLEDFLTAYKFLAKVDASANVRYLNGFREGYSPEVEEEEVEEESEVSEPSQDEESVDDYWQATDGELQRIALINDHVARSARLSVKLTMPILGNIERSPSVERAKQIERENYLRERKGSLLPNEEVERKLRELSAAIIVSNADVGTDNMPKVIEEKVEEEVICAIAINVYNEDGDPIPYEFYGEAVQKRKSETEDTLDAGAEDADEDTNLVKSEDDLVISEAEKIRTFVNVLYQRREDRREDLRETFDEIAQLVDRYMSANYDLGMVAGRQMSTTSGEFIVQHIEKEIMAYIDEQIAILPDPDLKKKKAKPEEVAMIRELLEEFLDDNMDIICAEVQEVEEEEAPIPEITLVYAVPGIGPTVDEEIVREFEEYARDVAKSQAEVFMPRNVRHFMCPPLERYVEHKYDEEELKVKEEVAITGGSLTD